MPFLFSTVAVLSDQLFISTASSERLEKFKKLFDQAAKNAMGEAMCQFSKMIAAYSEKCLADCGWNFEVSRLKLCPTKQNRISVGLRKVHGNKSFDSSRSVFSIKSHQYYLHIFNTLMHSFLPFISLFVSVDLLSPPLD